MTGILRHTLWYKTLFHRFLNSYRILHIVIITHPLIPPQTAVFARRRNKPTIISLLDRTKNYPITSSGERHNILHMARLHNIVINSNLAVPRNGTSRAPSPTILPRLHHAAKSLCSLRIYVVIGDRIGGADFLLRYYF